MRKLLNDLRLRLGILTEAEQKYDYVSQAVDRYDLEQRERHVTNGTWKAFR